MKIIRQIENYSLIKKGRWYYIDNGNEVSEYFDKIDAINYIECNTTEFLDRCNQLFF